MADFRLRVTAETQDAERKLRAVDKAANEASKNRNIKVDVSGIQDINKRFRDISASVKEAGNNIQTFYRFSKNIPGVGDRIREVEALAKGTAQLARTAPESAAALRENAKAGSILSNSFEAAGGAAGRLINTLAKTGFAIFAVKEAVGVLQAAFGGFFNETIGREIKLRETILKTQTTLASTNKVFRGGTEITDPYEKIVALTGEVGKRIDSIRERSIALAGVTSNDVIEVFGIVASQVGQIGGGLKEAEDLAINFSAALGTFGIPLYQARQEIGSILRGDITSDSYLAKALGITNQDITKAKGEAGGIVKFLEERLAASVAGQKIAAQGFAGVVSNIADLGELISQKFGAGLLDPMLGGLTRVFDFLFKIREEVFAISEGIGRGLGSLLSGNLTLIAGGSGLLGQIGSGAEGFASQLSESVKRAFASLQRDSATFVAPLRNILEEVLKTIGLLAEGLAKLAKGFVDINIENFKALVQIFSNLTEGVTLFAKGISELLKLYGGLLQLPFVQYLSQISVQFQLLERIGVGAAIRFGAAAIGLIAAWQPIVAFFQALVARIAALLAGLVIAIGAVITRIGTLIASFAATITSTYPAVEAFKQQLMGLSAAFTSAGASADKAGVSVARFGGATTGAARAVSTAIFGFIKLNLILLAVQLGVTLLIDIFGRWQRAQDKAASDRRAEEALKRLRTTYKDVGDSADEATKRAKQFEQALVDAKYNEAVERLEAVRKKLEEIKDLTSGNNLDFGDYMRRIAQLFNPTNFDAFLDQRKGEMFADAVYRKRVEDAKKAETEANRWSNELSKKSAEENIRLQANNRTNLEKEIGDLRRQQEDQLFQLRQQRAQKEVEIFRAAGELRIFQMEQANKKLIEGEEGASAAALESLNNYLSTRERGELEIEAAKKNLAIELNNLEKQIADYRLDNEKKIAEIRKRAGEYEKNVSDYRRQVAGQIAAGTGGGAATFGSTGNVKNAPGWVHGHFQTNTGTLDDLIKDVIPVLKALLDQGIPVELSSGLKVQGGKDDNYYRSILSSAAKQHKHRGDGRSIDLFVPEGTKVPVPLSDVSGPSGRGGISGVLPGSGKSWVGHLAPGSKAGGAAPIAAPKAPDFADIGAPAVGRYAEAVRSVASAMERLRTLQEALTKAQTAAAFEEIAKAAFPKVQVESYLDKVNESKIALTSLGQVTAQTYDPERLQLAAEYQNQISITQREVAQILKRAAEVQGVKQQDLIRLQDLLNKGSKKYTDDLAKQNQYKLQQLQLDRLRVSLQDSLSRTKSLGESTQELQTRTRLGTEGVRPELIEAEIKKLELQRQLNEAIKNANGDPALESQARFTFNQEAAAIDAEALAKIAANDPISGLIGKWRSELQDTRSSITSLAQSIQGEFAGAMSNAITGVISGTMTIGQAFGQMFQNIGRAFIEMATQMLAKAVVLQILQMFMPGSPGLSGGFGGGLSNSFTGNFGGLTSGMSIFPMRAGGGPVVSGMPYIVGERGPELFVPGSTGTVVTNQQTQALMATRSALGGGQASMSTAFEANRDTLNTISSTERERQVERYLTSGATSSEIKYSRVGTGDLPFVTEQDMLQATRLAAQEGAKLGQQRTLAALRGNPSARRGIGI